MYYKLTPLQQKEQHKQRFWNSSELNKNLQYCYRFFAVTQVCHSKSYVQQQYATVTQLQGKTFFLFLLPIKTDKCLTFTNREHVKTRDSTISGKKGQPALIVLGVFRK